MPENYRPKRGLAPYMLTGAIKNGALVEVKCPGCSPPRWYRPEDLMTLFGDVPCINLERIMRCGRCGLHVTTRVTVPTGEERQILNIRRLDRVWWVRRVSWRNE
ncbi:MAG: hypothetical protein AB7I34_19235 [Rhizobiaceae bacterium]